MAPAKKKARRGVGHVLSLTARGLVLAALTVACPAMALVLACGMLPTLVAMLVDVSEENTTGYTVGALNAAAVMPFLPGVWLRSTAGAPIASLLPNTISLIVIYAAAAVGWVLVALLPPLVEALEGSLVKGRCERARRAQNKLEEEWGLEIRRPMARDGT